ncbi:hypothetical protein [Streptomyces chrestomyceticus]|uniref:hypothetical protein n=1 Tax=Streptomyces chrestomyceticus TaxID=68185 RepID=UPI000F618274|nr:hypothetical protein [Streptomyces chrestomyceticus]
MGDTRITRRRPIGGSLVVGATAAGPLGALATLAQAAPRVHAAPPTHFDHVLLDVTNKVIDNYNPWVAHALNSRQGRRRSNICAECLQNP